MSLATRLEKLERRYGVDDELIDMSDIGFPDVKMTRGQFREILDSIDANTAGLPSEDKNCGEENVP